jgi:hypothetical protein
MSEHRSTGNWPPSRFQTAEWRFQRAGWGVWALIIAAATLGLLGSGPLSAARATASDESLRIDYSRFAQYGESTEVVFTCRIPQPGDVRLWVSKTWLDQVHVASISPAPARQIPRAEGVEFVFDSDVLDCEIRCQVEFEHFGQMRGSASLEGGSPVHFAQFVYP